MRPNALNRLVLNPSSMSLNQTHSWPATATTQNPPPKSPHGVNAHLTGRMRIRSQRASADGSIAVSAVTIIANRAFSLIGCHIAMPSLVGAIGYCLIPMHKVIQGYGSDHHMEKFPEQSPEYLATSGPSKRNNPTRNHALVGFFRADYFPGFQIVSRWFRSHGSHDAKLVCFCAVSLSTKGVLWGLAFGWGPSATSIQANLA